MYLSIGAMPFIVSFGALLSLGVELTKATYD